jgi:hypothetical protein
MFNGKTAIINFYAKLNNYMTYLEVGGQPNAGDRSTFSQVEIKYKDTIDPGVHVEDDGMPKNCKHYEMTSDAFFKKYKNSKKYDLIFIDGLHEHEQVYRDIEGSLSCLSENGTIVLHDMLPPSRKLEDINRTGTCWRAFADFRRKRKDLEMFTVPPPWGTEDGLSIIRFGKQEVFEKEIEYTYDFFLDNKVSLMNIITWDQFLRRHNTYCDAADIIRKLHFDANKYAKNNDDCLLALKDDTNKIKSDTKIFDFCFDHWKNSGRNEDMFFVLDDHDVFNSRLKYFINNNIIKQEIISELENDPQKFKEIFNLFASLRAKVEIDITVSDSRITDSIDGLTKNGVHMCKGLLSEEDLQEITTFQDGVSGLLLNKYGGLHGGYVDLVVDTTKPNSVPTVNLKPEYPNHGLLRLQSKSTGFFPPGSEKILNNDVIQKVYQLWYKNKDVKINRSTMDWLTPAKYNHNGWHFDILSPQLKVFVYLSDVSLDNGPTYYANGSHKLTNDFELKMKHATFIHGVSKAHCLGRRYGMNICTLTGGNVTYPSDDVVDNQPWELDHDPIKIDGQLYDKTVATAKRGDVMFIETSGYHSGNICQSGYRLDTVFTCPTESSFMGKFFNHIGK